MKYKSGFKYKLEASEWTQLNLCPEEDILTDYAMLSRDGLFTIVAGYAWDGPSGPTLDTDDVMTPSLIHDCLYQLMAEGHLPTTFRKKADKELTRLMKDRGVGWLRRRIWWRGVRLAGGGHLEPNEVKEVP